MKKLLFIILAIPMALLACTGGLTAGGSGADSISVSDSDSIAKHKFTTVFGSIPAIYEAEMLAITAKAREETDGSVKAMRGFMANLADSAYKEAELKATSVLINEMQGKYVRCTADNGLPYKVEPEAQVLTAILPKLQNLGGEERVFMAMNFTPDSVATKAYYVLVGAEGYVSVGFVPLPLTTEPTKVIGVIVAPNAPAHYLESCSEIHFIDKNTYTTLREQVKERQKQWRETYAREQGLLEEKEN